jgi:hypothetical protein
MDDTARAIARLQEEAKAEKSSESRKGESASTAPKRQAPPLVNGMGQRKIGGAVPQTSTKRPKTGGA